MNRKEAFLAMMDGKLISHEYFTSEEYLRFSKESGTIVCEQGYNFDKGWEDRQGVKDHCNWEEGWYLWDGKVENQLADEVIEGKIYAVFQESEEEVVDMCTLHCAFKDNDNCCSIQCSQHEREDGRNVYFKEKVG